MADGNNHGMPLALFGGGQTAELIRSGELPPALAEWLSSSPVSLRGVIAMLLESPLPMVIAWGPELRLIYNDPFDEVLGQRHAAALGEPARPVLASTWLGEDAIVSRVLKGEALIRNNVRFTVERPHDPASRWFTVALSPLRDDEGLIQGIIAVSVETTIAVENEDRLSQERNRLRDLFQQAPGFIAMGAGPDHVFEFANDAYYSLVGDRALVGKPVRDALPELAGQGFFELLDRAYASGTPFVGREIPIMLRRREAHELERRYIDAVYQPIKRNGEVVGILAEGYDVTEQKQAKDELLRLQSELIHISRVSAMSAMAATLAHELNQPLTAIKAYIGGARRLLDKLGPAATGEVKDALAEADAAGTRAAQIIRRLRTMVRRGEPEVEITDLGEVVREAVALAALGVAEEGVFVRQDICDGVIVSIDKVQIQQVVINLFRNAVEATLNSNRREIHVSVETARGAALLKVEDSGIGIETTKAEEVFSPLSTTKAAGLGVGLSISRTIVEAHRGKISAGMGALGGACLSVKLPLARPHNA